MPRPSRWSDVLHTEATILAVAFSPDGRRLASCEHRSDGHGSGTSPAAAPLSPPIRHEQTIRAIAFSPDGAIFATACDDGSVMRWDGVTGAVVGAPIPHDAPVSALRFSPDGSMIATASRAADSLSLGHERPDSRSRVRPGTTPRSWPYRFHPDGSRLAVAGDDGRVWLWETATGSLLEPTLRHQAAVATLAFSPDGRKLLTGCLDGRARLWDTNSWTTLAEFPCRTDIGCGGLQPLGTVDRRGLSGWDGSAVE